ncbi:UDP-N-acetylmuramoylalanine--D-glutamate ligase [Collibacillus ludicampi]|uniref:UDP-N-acetylmuramoylalanine--D-glutamate ligase n=1 Tax=Collibacillus ludicampi TaxID=2771369 RepID=A0AAV4LHY8_9BACL|nr:UDP-N-acetylmuramoylalanine--D-glutamate ligase [Collibacillus ludicampi]
MMDFRGKNILVLGLARSGAAVARLLHTQGARVTVNDMKERESLGPEVEELEERGIPVILGGHPEGIVSPAVDLIVKNPGIPYTATPVKKALQLGIPVVTEVEIAYLYCKAPILGITGSNGKTTTTTLTGKILEEAGLKPVVAGNIGRALSEIVSTVRSDQWVVAELSSFQLMGTLEFRPRIAVLLNLYEAHLDYHGTLEAYRQAKSRLFINQKEDDIAVLNADQPLVMELASSIRARIFPFSRTKRLHEGVFVQDGVIIARKDGQEREICNVSEVALPGEHNLENALAATAASFAAGACEQAIRTVLMRFRGVEHRLEYVGAKDGVKYYNDSKATNSQAALRAITSFPERVILIAGGLDRGDDFHLLIPVFQKHVKAIVTLGQSADKLLLAAEKAGVSKRIKVSRIEEAVQVAKSLAEPGDTVLLSPACASWDMYKSFEERGRIFKQAVHTM